MGDDGDPTRLDRRVSRDLGSRLAEYRLPAPPEGDALVQAVRASLGVWHAAPARVTVPILGAVYRSVLGKADCSLFLVGTTGLGKSELSALAAQLERYRELTLKHGRSEQKSY